MGNAVHPSSSAERPVLGKLALAKQWTCVIAIALLFASCSSSSKQEAGNGDASVTAKATGGTAGGSGGANAPGDASAGNTGDSGLPSGGGAGGAMDCPDGTNHVSGSRVQMQMLVTQEGDRSFYRMFDIERGAPCEFSPAADGNLRCMPSYWSRSEIYFLDSACTMAVYTELEQGPCEKAGVLMVPADSHSCGGGFRVFELGAEVTPTGPLYAYSGDTCVQASAPAEPLYAAGDEVPPSSFPLGEPQDMQRVGRLALTGTATADGAFRARGWSDTALDADGHCTIQQLSETELRCVPLGTRLDRTNSTPYADATCESPLFADPGLCGDPPAYAVEYPDPSCVADPWRIWRVGPEHMGDIYSGDTCDIATAPDNTVLHDLSEVSTSDLVRLEQRVDDTDDGRLQRRFFVSDEGGCWASSTWDSELKVPCSFNRTMDDQWRCVPAVYSEVYAGFADAACTMPAAYAVMPECEDSLTPPRYVTDTDYAGCRQVTVYEVGNPLQMTPMLYRDNAGTCVQSSLPMVTTWLELTPMDPERFMAAELQ